MYQKIRRIMVRITGVEPARTFVHMDLNHARLPIPPYPQALTLQLYSIMLKKDYQQKNYAENNIGA